jgi:hypothetical protein
MRRRAFLLLTALSWLMLAGIDLHEHLNGYGIVETNAYSETGSMVNDIVDSGDGPCSHNISVMAPVTCYLFVSLPASSARTCKLYKLHQIYQI